jgi:hypothetical protein
MGQARNSVGGAEGRPGAALCEWTTRFSSTADSGSGTALIVAKSVGANVRNTSDPIPNGKSFTAETSPKVPTKSLVENAVGTPGTAC